MYQGLESTMWRHILWNAGYFGCISQVRSTLPKAETKKAQIVNDITAGSPFPHFGQISTMLTVTSYRRNRWDDLEYADVSQPWVVLGCLVDEM